MEPDGSQITPEYSENLSWLEQFLRPNTNPGTDLSVLDWDGHRIKQASRSQSQKISKTGWGIVMGVRENHGDGGEGELAQITPGFLFVSPNI